MTLHGWQIWHDHAEYLEGRRSASGARRRTFREGHGMTQNSTLEPVARGAASAEHGRDMEGRLRHASPEAGSLVDAPLEAMLDDRPGGHLDAMIVPEGTEEPRRDGAA